MSDVTVILVGGPRAPHVMALVGTWCKAGLVDESVWVMVDEVERDESGIARVPALLVSPDGTRHGELFEMVGARRIDVLRLVAAQLVTSEGRPETAYLTDVRGIAELVQMAMPLRVGVHDGSGTQSIRVNLIIGESKVEGLALDHLIAGWDVNAIVAGEDRADVDRSNVFVRSRNFPPHAAAAIASVGGLWAGVPCGALDHLPSDSSVGGGEPVVVRPSVRILIGDGPSERILKEAMTLLTEDEVGPAPLLPWALPAADPISLAKRATAFLLDRGDWRDARLGVWGAEGPPVRPSGGPVPAPRTVADGSVSPLTLLKLGAAQAFAPAERPNLLAEDAPQGTPQAMAALARRRLHENERQVAARVRAIEHQGVPAPDPRTWEELRQLCFALVDGGDLPSGFPTPMSGGLRELAPPWAVAPDPEDHHWPVSRRDAHVLRDPMSARTIRAEGEQAEQLSAWVERRRRSVTWQLAENLADRMSRLQAEAVEDRRRGAGAAPPDIGLLVAAQRRFRVRWRVALGLFVSLAALAGVGALTGFWLLHPAALAAAASVPIAVIVFANRAYFRALVAYERAVDERIALRRAAQEARARARREGSRLSVLYVGLTDWAEILGRVIHRPWYPGGNHQLDLPEGIVESFPASVGVAVPKSRDSARERRLAAWAVPVVCTPGWSAAGFGHLINELDQRRDGLGGLIGADHDMHDGPLSPRRRLLEACRGGEAGVLLPGPAVERVEDAVLEGLLDPPETLVQRVGRFGDGVSLPDSDFFSAALATVTPFSLEQWSPSGLQRGRHVPDSSVAWLPHIETDLRREGLELRRSSGSVAMRVDISRRCDPSDLVLFGESLAGLTRRQRREVQGRHTLVQEGVEEWV